MADLPQLAAEQKAPSLGSLQPWRRALGLLFGMVVSLGAATAATFPQWPDAWQSKLAADHPLSGRIWSARDQRIATPQMLAEAMTGASLILVGEVHDNLDHHRIQGWAATTIASRNEQGTPGQGTGAAVFEHIRADQQQTIDRFYELGAKSRRLYTSDDLFGMLDWNTSGWPKSDTFAPLYGAVLSSKLRIVPGDAPRELVRIIAQKGESALSAGELARLKLDIPLEPLLQDALLGELEASHCGLLPRSAFGGMAVAQRYRDAHLADALLGAANRHGFAVLFAGNGHVRADRGVPRYLRHMAPDKTMTSVSLIEVETGNSDPAAYVETGPDGQPVADYIVFTPRAERADPCERMRERFGKKG